MNWAYVHLLINHVPVILAPIGFVVAILALITKRRSVWLYALATLTLSGLSAYPVMASGDEASHIVRRIPGVSRDAIEEHEESGDTAMWFLLAAGVVAAYAWWRMTKQRPQETLPGWLVGLVLLTGAAAAGTVSYASLEGGYIMHKEAHQTPPPNQPGAINESGD
jgi:hypothetical protein